MKCTSHSPIPKLGTAEHDLSFPLCHQSPPSPYVFNPRVSPETLYPTLRAQPALISWSSLICFPLLSSLQARRCFFLMVLLARLPRTQRENNSWKEKIAEKRFQNMPNVGGNRIWNMSSTKSEVILNQPIEKTHR